jgi:hypothetical protein
MAEIRLVAEHREQLWSLLVEAAQFEHMILCQYLYACCRVQPATAAANPSITDWVNVVTDVSPGADPTGNADSYSAIQAAINAAAALPNNGAVYFPVGTYLIRSGLLLLPGVVLLGPHPYAQDYWAKAGAVLTIGGSFAPQPGYPVSAAI